MYPESEIQDIIENLNHGMTVRGNLVAECIMFHGKNIECRKQKIRHKYLALHLGSGKIKKDLERHLKLNYGLEPTENQPKLKKGHIVAVLKMGESKHLSELTQEEWNNKWIYSEGGYSVMNYIEKVYMLKNPIKSRGFQCMNWNLKNVDNALKKKNKFDIPIKDKINTELRKLQQGYIKEYEMIGKDCVDIIEEYKIDMEKYENDVKKIDECIASQGIRKGKVFKVDLTLGEIKRYYQEKKYNPKIQVQVEIRDDDKNMIRSETFDAYLGGVNLDDAILEDVKVYALWNSYVSKIMCLDLGEYTEEDYIKLMHEKIGYYIIEDEEN